MNQPIVKSVRVQCSLAHAFDVFTARLEWWWPRSHRMLAGARIELEGRVGGRFFECDGRGRETDLGQVVRWEPPHRVTYTWVPGGGVGPTEVDVTFRADGPATVVHVSHAEGRSELGAAWTRRATKFDAAWDDVLPAFATYIEPGARQ